jgi:hypothetical protein
VTGDFIKDANRWPEVRTLKENVLHRISVWNRLTDRSDESGPCSRRTCWFRHPAPCSAFGFRRRCAVS